MYPTEYIQFLIHFHGDYDYFECHEILEEYWKTKPRGNRDHYLVGSHSNCSFFIPSQTL